MKETNLLICNHSLSPDERVVDFRGNKNTPDQVHNTSISSSPEHSHEGVQLGHG